MSDIFISRSAVGTGSAVATYTVPTADSGAVPPVPPTTAIIKSIRLSNQTGQGVLGKAKLRPWPSLPCPQWRTAFGTSLA